MHVSFSQSPTVVGTEAEQGQIGAVQTNEFYLGEGARSTWLSGVVICLMGFVLIGLFWFPLKRIFANVEINYNEGWNAYRAVMVASRIPIYGVRPQYFGTGTAYPPLSFHLIGWLGTTNTFVAVGRWISFMSLILTGILVALIVRRACGSATAAIFSFLLYEISIALLLPNRIGMNDPQLLAEALSTAGLYCYVRNPISTRLLCMSAILFCLAGFTKQTLIVFPAAVAIDLLLRSRKAFVTWAGAMILCAGILLILTFRFDGPYFALHLAGKRTYSYWRAWSQFHHYALPFQALFVVATAWSIWALRSRRVFVLAFLFSNVLAFLLGGGAGVDMNIFFSPLAAMVIACGLALSDIRFGFEDWQPALLNPAATLMFALLFASIMIFVPGQLRRDREKMRALPTLESEFRSAIELTKASPGPALCESLLLCYEAGKPFEYESFSVRDEIKTGQIREEDVLQLLRTHHFQTVQIDLREDEAVLKGWDDLRNSLLDPQTDPDKQGNFTPNFMSELLSEYHLALRTSNMALFTAN
jgi:hypothetical protein